ncbi:peptidyl-tRNA hydrolase-domain-containing protein [Gamsiella multidivaricata]|uniref:peptidyl-tRNA hydrolase-domain-containing protein n=1 Tax=Gamsiella multidivaricata TaxID=101098 RepID=UPI0022202319|nr:peptidyl-tRNA hydrolase-domain-containing protein [Gamsiella multidivaricata]KAG0371131.1 peptidyl-tRNA hydrolase protein 1 [Gamsiella multidivaricata]KAI7830419.1 peptidyl-tRNA hydrolase-domain-containing protein [Gamsiella multidivaricata]
MAALTRHIVVVGLGNYGLPGTRHNVGMMVLDNFARRFNAPWSKNGTWRAEVATVTTTIAIKNRERTIMRARMPPTRTPSAATVNTGKNAINTSTPAVDENAAGTVDTASTEPAPIANKKEKPEMVAVELKLTLLKPLQPMNISGSAVSRAVDDLRIPKTDVLVIHDDMERDIGKISYKSEGSANGHNGIKSCIKYLRTQHFKRLRIGVGRPASKDRSPDFIANYILGKFKPLEIEKLEELVYDQAGDEVIKIMTRYPDWKPWKK